MDSTIVTAERLTRQVQAPGGLLTILHEVSLAVKQGEAVAVLGASGSGKSTLLGLLAGLDLPSAGSVSLLGHELNSLDEDARARLRSGRVGFVFQSFQLLPGLTALENAMLPLELVGRSDAAAVARELLGELGLAARLHHYPLQLSGGEQQRVAIARAFAGGPRIVFADEPTGNLDQQTGARIIDLMFALQQREHITLLLVTHDTALAQRCHRQLRLVAGRLQAD